MSEETQETQNDGTWSGLRKTIIGTLTTIIGGGGIWLSTQLFGGHSDKEETKTEQVAQPAATPVVINLQNNNTNQQKQQSNNNGGTTIIREKVVEKPASQPAPSKPKEEEDPW